MIVKITDIKWITDGHDCPIRELVMDLPDEFNGDEEAAADYLTDKLSDVTGWLHDGFKCEIVE